MYNILLIDDDPISRSFTRQIINWEKYGFSLRCELSNGTDAVNLFRDRHFSLVLIDIKHPYAESLKLCAELQAVNRVPIILFSSCSDFQLAKEALKYQVRDYFIKPIQQKDLLLTLKSIKFELDTRILMEKQIHVGLPAARDRFVKEWVLGYCNFNQYELTEQSRILRFPIENVRSFRCMMIEMDIFNDSYFMDKDLQLVRFAVRNIIEDLMQDKGLLFDYTTAAYGLLLYGCKESLLDDKVLTLAGLIRDCISQFTRTTITIGIGTLCDSPMSVKKSFLSAQRALENKFFSGSNTVHLHSTPAAEDTLNVDIRNRYINKIIKAMLNQNHDAFISTLSSQWEETLRQFKHLSAIQSLSLELLVRVFQTIKEQGAPALDDWRLYPAAFQCKTSDELFQFVLNVCMTAKDLIQQNQNCISMIDQVKSMVQQKFHQNISLKLISQQLFVNTAYLGQKFKAQEKISFNEYLLQTRMERAKDLLLNTNKKVCEIAAEVGFRELDWFYKKFKEYAGVSASEFRSKILVHA